MIAGPEASDAFPDFGDHACHLVSIDGGQCPAPAALGIDDVAVTDGTPRHFDLELPGAGRIQDDILDDERFAERLTDGCAHRVGLPGARW